MKMTEVQRCIILVNIMGIILKQYDDDETTPPIAELKRVCVAFAQKQCGVEDKIQINRFKQKKLVRVVTNAKRHEQYIAMDAIGDRIWKTAMDKYAKQNIKADAVALIEAIWLSAPDILAKHAKLTKERIDAYRYEFESVERSARVDGTAIGGYIAELLMKEMGIEVNGKLRALRLRLEEQKGEAA